MPSLSSNINSMLGLCGYVEAGKYPNFLGSTAKIINQIARLMMREARLSDQNQYLKFKSLNSPSKEHPLPDITDPNSICTVEIVVDSATDKRADIDIVGRLELNAREERGSRACARFGRPTRLRFSWDPSLDSEQIYVGYEVLPADATEMTSIPNLPESFHDVLCYRGAALVMETILEKVPGKIFLQTMEMMESQWEEWCKRDAEERPQIKPGFGDLDTEDSMEMVYY